MKKNKQDHSWKLTKLGDISEEVMYGMNSQSTHYDGKHKYIRITDIDEKTHKYNPSPLTSPQGVIDDKFQLKTSDILFARTGASVGKSYLYEKKDGNLFFAGFLIKFSIIKADSKYIFYQTLLDSYDKWVKSISVRSGQPGINAEEYKTLPILLPPFPEQEKIVEVLETWDEYLEKLSKKIRLKKRSKKGLMLNLITSKIRINHFKDKWNTLKLGEICTRLKRKNTETNTNILTISAQQGLVNQGNYFNKQIASINLTKYSLLHRGDFAYNKSYSKGYPMGAIKRLKKYSKGIVSSLYITFETTKKVNPEFLEYYFNCGTFNKEIGKTAQEGARNHGLLNIGINDFFDCDLHIPSLPEQTAIAEILEAADNEIELLEKKRHLIEAQKKFLLNNLITGKIRLPEFVQKKDP